MATPSFENVQVKASLRGRAVVVAYNALVCCGVLLAVLAVLSSDCGPIGDFVCLCAGLVLMGCLVVASLYSSEFRLPLITCSYLVAAATLILSGYIWYVSDGQSLKPVLPLELIVMGVLLSPNVIVLVLNDDRIKRIRYSLRTLCIAFIIVGLLLGLFVRFAFNSRGERFAAQDDAMRAIDEAGGYVGVDDYWVTSVHLSGLKEPVSTSLLEKIASLPHLHSLDLSRTVVSDEALMCLAKCSGLRFLYLTKTVVSDEAVYALRKQMPGLHIEAEWGRWTTVPVADVSVERPNPPPKDPPHPPQSSPDR